MPYTKIKHNKGTVTLTRVEDRSTTDSVEQTLTSHDDPRPEFVTALKSVDGATAPVVINTPHVPETPTSDAGPCLPPSVCDLLSNLEAEADKFWKGERAQADMFEPPSDGVTITEPYVPPEGMTATISVNGGPAVNLGDEEAVIEALTPLVDELHALSRGQS